MSASKVIRSASREMINVSIYILSVCIGIQAVNSDIVSLLYIKQRANINN